MPSRARWWGGSLPISRPWKVTFPPRTGSSPMMLSMVVVLPAPFRPTRHTDSLLPTLSETRRRIWAGPRQVSMASISSMHGPDQRRGDLLVVPDLVRRPAREDGALMHRHDPVGVLEHHVHVVLDDHGGDMIRSDDGSDHVHDRCLLAGADPAGRLVEEEQLGLQGIGDGDVEQLALSLGDATGQLRRLRLQPELPEDVERLLPHGLLAVGEGEELPRQVLAGKDRERHVVEERQLVEEVDQLEAARDARLDAVVHGQVGDVGPAEGDGPAVRAQQAADQVDEARLAGAVGADQREDLAFADGEVDAIHGAGVAEVPGELLGLEEVHRETRFLTVVIDCFRVPTMPAGRASTRNTRMAPISACQ